MPSSHTPRHASQPKASRRQQWEVAVLMARIPAQIASIIVVALLTPGLNGVYAPRA